MVYLLFLLFVPLFSQSIPEIVTESGASWVASNTAPQVYMGFKPSVDRLSIPPFKGTGLAVPASFDARKQWANCTMMFDPLNQGQCGSCWAFGATKSFGDRLCIQSYAKTNLLLSEQQLVSCNLDGEEGCQGGDPATAMRYIAEYGLPTSSCVPYTSGDGHVPSCTTKCSNGDPMKLYYADIFSLRWHITVDGIQESIYTQGPVEACFTVYEDFMYYKSGVYHHVTGNDVGGHCIVLLGWGTTPEGEDYWIAQNSWGSSWGMAGYFWIEKGVDECGIEREVFSINPDL